MLEDARQRFLAQGGIPQRDTLYAAIVDSEKLYGEIRSPWQSSDEGLDLTAALPCVLNDVHSAHITPEQLVTQPQALVGGRIPEESEYSSRGHPAFSDHAQIDCIRSCTKTRQSLPPRPYLRARRNGRRNASSKGLWLISPPACQSSSVGERESLSR